MRLLLIDDDESLCEMLSDYFAREGFATSVVGDGALGVEAALAGGHHVIILDSMLPGMSGVAALREIRRRSDIPLIMLTARGDNLDRILGLEMGADDYVTKPCDPRELVARVRAVARRRASCPDPAERGPATLNGLSLVPGTRKADVNGRALELTASEFNVLELLIRAAGSVKTKDELSLEALGRRREPYDRSLDVHVSNIRQKLSALDASDVVIETVRGIGYRMKVEL